MKYLYLLLWIFFAIISPFLLLSNCEWYQGYKLTHCYVFDGFLMRTVVEFIHAILILSSMLLFIPIGFYFVFVYKIARRILNWKKD